MKAWKTIDAEHADAVARGALRIGTLGEYVDLETGGAEPADRSGPRVPAYWAFCMTEPGWRAKDHSGAPKAIFEIADIALLSRYIMQTFAVQMLGAGHGPVRYGPPPVGAPLVDAFLKDEAFAAEREIRIVFEPRPGVAVDGPLLMKPDYALAALFKRVE